MRETAHYLLLFTLLISACGSVEEGRRNAEQDSERIPATEPAPLPQFTPLAEEIGIDFEHYNAATELRRLPETMGSGVAFFDYDNDAYPDLYFVNGAGLDDPSPLEISGQLYRNLGDGSFENVTSGSGLDKTFYGMGVAVGDFENDGWKDLAVSTVDGIRLFRNREGTFEDVTLEMGADCPGFGASLAFLDYDRDGFLDLFVSRYVVWTPETDIPCSPDGVHRTYCTPEVYPPISNCLLRNVDGEGFVNRSQESGIGAVEGKALGLAILDYDDDDWPDIAVANDTVGNFLFVNEGDGTFQEIGIDSGMAYSESGAARGGMGIDIGDIDRDGQVDIVIGNFSQEMVAFFRGLDSGYFIDDAAQVGIGLPTLMTLAFGTLVEDYNNDSWLDVLLVNGHIEPEINVTRQSQSYRQPPQFFRNRGEGQFEQADLSEAGLEGWKLVGRGFASGDYDLDGDLDFVITQNGGPAYLLRNNQPATNWLRLQLRGTRSSRIPYGTKVEVTAAGAILTRYLVSGRSYLSASEPVLHVGLGEIPRVDRIRVTWPSGAVQIMESPIPNQTLLVEEERTGTSSP